MKKFLILFLSLIFVFSLSFSSFAIPSSTRVDVSGSISEVGSVRFVLEESTHNYSAYYTFGNDYIQVSSAYLGTTPLPFSYEGVFIQFDGQSFYSTVKFTVNSSDLLTALDRGDSIFLTVSSPAYSDQSLTVNYESDDGFNLFSSDFISKIDYNEGHPLSDQRPLIPYYVTFSDSNFVYTYVFDSAYFNKNFPGVVLTYDSTLTFEGTDAFISLKFNDFENSSLRYNDGVGINVVYSLLKSQPVGSGSSVPGGSPNDPSDALYFLTYLSFLGTIPFNIVSPALDVEIFGVNILYAFCIIVSVVVIAAVVFGILKVVKK